MGNSDSKPSTIEDADKNVLKVLKELGKLEYLLRRDKELVLSQHDHQDLADADAAHAAAVAAGHTQDEEKLELMRTPSAVAESVAMGSLAAKYAYAVEALARTRQLSSRIVTHVAYRDSIAAAASAEKTSPKEQARLSELADKITAEINNELGRFDQAWHGAVWLVRNYELRVEIRRLTRELAGTAPLNAVQAAKASEEDHDSADAKRVKRRAKLEAQHVQHHVESLNVGLRFLDASQTGTISPSDVPDMPTPLFARLDANSDKAISVKDLQKSVKELHAELLKAAEARDKARLEFQDAGTAIADFDAQHQDEQLTAKQIKKREALAVAVDAKRVEFKKSLAEFKEKQSTVDEVHRLFGGAFLSNVFDAISLSESDLKEQVRALRKRFETEDTTSIEDIKKPPTDGLGNAEETVVVHKNEA